MDLASGINAEIINGDAQLAPGVRTRCEGEGEVPG